MRVAAVLVVAVLVAVAVARPDPKPAPGLVEARQRLLRGNYAEARAAYEKLLPAPAAAVGVSRGWRAEGEYAKAIDGLTEALKAAPDSAELLAERADALYEVGRWEDAMADATAALARQDDQFLARWVRARHLRDTGDLDTADKEMRWFVREYTRLSNADKEITDPDKLLIVAQAGAENARWNRLPNQFKFILATMVPDARKAEPNFWPAEALAGFLLLEKFNRPEANDAFDDALKVNPSAAEALVGKGEAAFIKYELKDAEQFAQQALKINPRLPSALRLMADVGFMGGDFPAVEKHLLAARAVNPRDPITLGKLAAVYLVTRRQAEFDGVVKMAESFDKKPAVFYHELGEYLDDRRLYTRAAEYLKKAADLRPKLAPARTSLGMLYLRLAREQDGRPLLEESFKADPFNVRVANTRKVLDHLGKYETIKTPHYDVRYNADTDKLLAKFVAEYAEEIHADLKRQFGYEPPDRTPLEVYSRHDMFSGRTVGLPDLHTIGACTGRVVAMASPKAVGVAKPFNWGRVLRHELVHIFNLAQTDFQCPHWLTEGLAVRNEHMARPPQWVGTLRDRFDADNLFTLDTITMGFVRPRSPDEWGLAYCQSQIYVEYLVKTHGEAAVGKVLAGYQAGLDTSAVLKAACGVDQPTFEKGYKAYVEQLLKPYRTGQKKPADEKAMTFDELVAAQKAKPDDPELAARLSEQLFRRGKPAEARKLVETVLEKQPGHARAAMVKARLLLEAGDVETARGVVDAAVSANPDDTRFLLRAGGFYAEVKEWAKAADVLEKGRKLDPLGGDWLEQLARVYTEAKQTDKLIGVLKEVVTHDPDELAGRIKLAKTALEAKDLANAEFYAREAVRIDVTNPDARAVLLAALKAAGKADEVEKLTKWFDE